MAMGEERLYTFHYTVTTRISPVLIKMGSDESRFNVSLIVKDKVTRQCPQITNFDEKESRSGFELRSFCLPA